MSDDKDTTAGAEPFSLEEAMVRNRTDLLEAVQEISSTILREAVDAEFMGKPRHIPAPEKKNLRTRVRESLGARLYNLAIRLDPDLEDYY